MSAKPRYLLLAPHNDDETLFAAYTIQRYQPHVAIVLRPERQADLPAEIRATSGTRRSETERAMRHFGYLPVGLLAPWLTATWEQWSTSSDIAPKFGEIVDEMRTFDRLHNPDHVWAPAIEEGGHEQHNLVGEAALEVFGAEHVTGYMTYRRGFGRSTSELEVLPRGADDVAAKLHAMAEYRSQIALASTRPWFTDMGLFEFSDPGRAPPP